MSQNGVKFEVSQEKHWKFGTTPNFLILMAFTFSIILFWLDSQHSAYPASGHGVLPPFILN